MIRAAPTLVLMYHRVAAPESDVHDLCVAPERFEAQLEHLRRHERAVPLTEARTGAARRRIVITFDDGYADNALAARPLLEAAGLPATFFISVGLIGGTRPLWWDELETLVLVGTPRARHLEVEIGGARLLVDVGSPAARERAHWAIYHRLKPMGRDAIEEVLTQLRPQVEVAEGSAHRFMTVDELADTARSPVVTVGGHATTHQLLVSLDAEEQRREIVGGREQLRAMTGEPVDTFAYPFGGVDAFDDTAVRMVDEAGYDIACAGWEGLVRRRTDRFRIPRVVVKDWDAATFAARLDAWFSR